MDIRPREVVIRHRHTIRQVMQPQPITHQELISILLREVVMHIRLQELHTIHLVRTILRTTHLVMHILHRGVRIPVRVTQVQVILTQLLVMVILRLGQGIPVQHICILHQVVVLIHIRHQVAFMVTQPLDQGIPIRHQLHIILRDPVIPIRRLAVITHLQVIRILHRVVIHIQHPEVTIRQVVMVPLHMELHHMQLHRMQHRHTNILHRAMQRQLMVHLVTALQRMKLHHMVPLHMGHHRMKLLLTVHHMVHLVALKEFQLMLAGGM